MSVISKHLLQDQYQLISKSLVVTYLKIINLINNLTAIEINYK